MSCLITLHDESLSLVLAPTVKAKNWLKYLFELLPTPVLSLISIDPWGEFDG
jgi:hypothetical protein